MPGLMFPFWIVTTRSADISLPVVAQAGYVAAFTSAEKATAHMVGRRDTYWQMKLVSRPTFAEIVESLRLLGVKGLCMEPSKDYLGTLIDFDSLPPTP